jgi:hypothetical protein
MLVIRIVASATVQDRAALGAVGFTRSGTRYADDVTKYLATPKYSGMWNDANAQGAYEDSQTSSRAVVLEIHAECSRGVSGRLECCLACRRICSRINDRARLYGQSWRAI